MQGAIRPAAVRRARRDAACAPVVWAAVVPVAVPRTLGGEAAERGNAEHFCAGCDIIAQECRWRRGSGTDGSTPWPGGIRPAAVRRARRTSVRLSAMRNHGGSRTDNRRPVTFGYRFHDAGGRHVVRNAARAGKRTVAGLILRLAASELPMLRAVARDPPVRSRAVALPTWLPPPALPPASGCQPRRRPRPQPARGEGHRPISRVATQTRRAEPANGFHIDEFVRLLYAHASSSSSAFASCRSLVSKPSVNQS